MDFDYVISLEQQSPAEAQAAAAQARADAQADAQRVREDAQRIREETQRIREQVLQEVRVGRGQGRGEQVIVGPPTPPWQRWGSPEVCVNAA